jgi:hypothetical protein
VSNSSGQTPNSRSIMLKSDEILLFRRFHDCQFKFSTFRKFFLGLDDRSLLGSHGNFDRLRETQLSKWLQGTSGVKIIFRDAPQAQKVEGVCGKTSGRASGSHQIFQIFTETG